MTLEVLKALAVRCLVSGINHSFRFAAIGGSRSRVVFHERKVSRI